MIRISVALVAALVLVSGCQQPNIDEMLKPPPRPTELDRLEAFVGTWDGTGEITMAGGEKRTFKGTDKYSWEADKWTLLARSEGMMGANKMFGAGLWMWDQNAKLFRYGSTDNYGMIMTGTCKYDPKTQTWHMKGQTCDTVHGQRSVGEGTLKMPDPNTMEWQWTEWDGWHLIKFMEMQGTSHRK